MNNLESEIYKLSFELSEILDENEINKLLGILSSDGVYAMWVYAMDKLDWKFSENIEEMKNMDLFRLIDMISEIDKYVSRGMNYEDLLSEIANLTNDIKCLKKEIENLKKENRGKNSEVLNENNNNLMEKEIERNKTLNKYFHELAQDLNKLLFMKELLEKVFIYARYHARAKGK